MITMSTNIATDPWCFTMVYGPQTDAEKMEFLDELCHIHSAIMPMWLIAGDLNLILHEGDKNRTTVNRRNMARFQ